MSKAANPHVARRIAAALAASGVGNNGLDRALGKKPGYTSTMLGRESEPSASHALQIAEVLGVRFEWLVTGEGPMRAETPEPPSAVVRVPFCAAPGWADAEREARARYAHVPEYAWAGARELAGPAVPGHVTPETILAFARAWEMSSPPLAAGGGRPSSSPNNLRLVR